MSNFTEPGGQEIFLSVFNSLFSVGGTVGNILVCTLVAAVKTLQTPTNLIIASLAIADLLVCMIAQPMYAAWFVSEQEIVFETIRKSLSWVSLLASVGNLFGVTVDRFLAISTPLKYPTRMNNKTALTIISIVWIIAILLGIFNGLPSTAEKARLLGQMYAMGLMIAIVPMYIRIYCIARRQARIISRQITSINTRKPSEYRRFSRENVAFRTIGIIIAAFLICWLPLLLNPFLYRANKEMGAKVFPWVNTLALCSSSVNPVVYCWRTQTFKRLLKKIVHFYVCCRKGAVMDKPNSTALGSTVENGTM